MCGIRKIFYEQSGRAKALPLVLSLCLSVSASFSYFLRFENAAKAAPEIRNPNIIAAFVGTLVPGFSSRVISSGVTIGELSSASFPSVSSFEKVSSYNVINVVRLSV